jgi:CDP-paratose 2-epimerase
MSVALITGSAGLVGSEAALHFGKRGMHVVGIDNDSRHHFFGPEGSTSWNGDRLRGLLGSAYEDHAIDIRDRQAVLRLFQRWGSAITLVIHAAAQPSHDWAARAPFVDFDVNAGGTLNILEAARLHSPECAFIFMSSNKVYGDNPNQLPLIELDTRWEIEPTHRYAAGIQEDLSVDSCLHSLFGVSKLSADMLVQEYGRYFDLNTVCFRCGTLTGSNHSPTELHGFLAYLMRCVITRTPYLVYGHKAKQVRDAMHSCDLIRAFECFAEDPTSGDVYNIGGGRISNVSMLEAIAMTQEISGEELVWAYSDTPRIGDHIWWIGDNTRFVNRYPRWRQERGVQDILFEIYQANCERWAPSAMIG